MLTASFYKNTPLTQSLGQPPTLHHFLGTSLALLWHFLGTSLALPRHYLALFCFSSHFLGTSSALPQHFLGISSALPQPIFGIEKKILPHFFKIIFICICASICIVKRVNVSRMQDFLDLCLPECIYLY